MKSYDVATSVMLLHTLHFHCRGELATFLATELHITKLKAGEAICVVGEPADSMKLGVDICEWKCSDTYSATCTYIYIYHMYFGSRLKRLEKVRFPFRRYAAYGPSVIASNFAD